MCKNLHNMCFDLLFFSVWFVVILCMANNYILLFFKYVLNMHLDDFGASAKAHCVAFILAKFYLWGHVFFPMFGK